MNKNFKHQFLAAGRWYDFSLVELGKYWERNKSIVIHFHQTRFRMFKDYYVHYVILQLKKYFPNLISYNRFIQLMA